MKIKYNLYKFVNPLLKTILPNLYIRRRSQKLIERHNIRYLDIGGALAVEGYYVIHLSPVEIYGIPQMRRKALRFTYNSKINDFDKEIETVKKACTLNFDLLKGVPLENNSIDGINMSHFLEHFTQKEGIGILKECFRVLKPNGILRISCPDLRKYAFAYTTHNHGFFSLIKKKKIINELYENLEAFGDLLISKAYDGTNGHKWFYDAESAIQLASQAGFKNGLEKKLHQTILPEISIIEPTYREVESFYVEVYK